MASCAVQAPTSAPSSERCLLALPAEIRIHILEYVFDSNRHDHGFVHLDTAGGIVVDDDYTANSRLQPLSACRQMYHDGSLLALNRTSFMVTNLFFNIPERLALLHAKQVEAIRNIAFVADARHFRKLRDDWGRYPFGMPSLRLDAVTIVLHRSSFWHYLFDFTRDITMLLRELQGVKRLVFVKNSALVKGSFKTWYNRLVGLMMKIDHCERYDKHPANPEKTWWAWTFDEVAQSFCLEACPPKPLMREEEYMLWAKPLMEELRASIETEEYNPDPRSWNGT